MHADELPTQPDNAPPSRRGSSYLFALGTAYLLAPEGAVEEGNLRALFLQRANVEGIDGDELLALQSDSIRAGEFD